MGNINICTEQENEKATMVRRRSTLKAYDEPDNQIQEIRDFLTLTSQNTSAFNLKTKEFTQNTQKTINDFRIIRVLGRGAFGKVMLAEDVQDQSLYAMKIIEKKQVTTKQEMLHTLSERYILQSMEHPFIVSLHYAFQTSNKLYLLVDFMAGGELFYLLRKCKRFSEDIAKFYAAELVLALEYLHSRNIIYRDIKPENILLGKDGHIKITDFGLSKVCYTENQVAYSMCGTPEYIAPEIIAGKGYTNSADWFSFGSVLYDMLTGKPPFYSKNKHQILKNITSKQVPLPQDLSTQAKSLLKGLFNLNPKKRLGSKQGAVEIKKHPFFKKIDFIMLQKKKIRPPFNFSDQKILNPMGFDNNLQKQIPIDSLLDEKLGSSDNNFEGFTYQKSHISPQTLLQNIQNSKNYILEEEYDEKTDD